nr:hypothetical protein Iba_chr04bCG18850 [Ipomoea batatas]
MSELVIILHALVSEEDATERAIFPASTSFSAPATLYQTRRSFFIPSYRFCYPCITLCCSVYIVLSNCIQAQIQDVNHDSLSNW